MGENLRGARAKLPETLAACPANMGGGVTSVPSIPLTPRDENRAEDRGLGSHPLSYHPPSSLGPSARPGPGPARAPRQVASLAGGKRG